MLTNIKGFEIIRVRACCFLASSLGANHEIAKNHMKMMNKGDLAFFYHSNCKTPGIAGIMEIVQEATVDGNYQSHHIKHRIN